MVERNVSFHWAWIILATCFVDLFVNYSARLGYSVVLPEMIRTLGFGRAAAGSIFNAYLFSSEYSIKETSFNVTIHSPPESCTFSLGDRQTVTTSGAMLDGWQVNHPWALSRVSPLSKKNQKN